MNKLFANIFISTALLMLSACASTTVTISDDQAPASLISAQKVLLFDGAEPASPFKMEFPAGEHTLQVEYRTYSKTITCEFSFTAESGVRYEIVRLDNPQPLTLFRSKRFSWMWANRYDPVAPKNCE